MLYRNEWVGTLAWRREKWVFHYDFTNLIAFQYGPAPKIRAEHDERALAQGG